MTDWLSGVFGFIQGPEPAHNEEINAVTGNHINPPDHVSLASRVEELLQPDLHKADSDEFIQEIQIPTVFAWCHGGRRVYLITSLDDWESKHEMHRSQTDFSKILDLPTGRKIQYRFEVDGRLLCDPEQKHVRGSDGGYVNEVFVETTAHESFLKSHHSAGKFTQEPPDPDDYVREPPHAPAHLGNIILNHIPETGGNPLQLPVPSHVLLNHIYVAERKAVDVVVLGMTQRFQQKTFTTVYYKNVDISQEPRRSPPKPRRYNQPSQSKNFWPIY